MGADDDTMPGIWKRKRSVPIAVLLFGFVTAVWAGYICNTETTDEAVHVLPEETNATSAVPDAYDTAKRGEFDDKDDDDGTRVQDDVLRPTLYLHIGPHKTGTSTIQKSFFGYFQSKSFSRNSSSIDGDDDDGTNVSSQRLYDPRDRLRFVGSVNNKSACRYQVCHDPQEYMYGPDAPSFAEWGYLRLLGLRSDSLDAARLRPSVYHIVEASAGRRREDPIVDAFWSHERFSMMSPTQIEDVFHMVSPHYNVKVILVYRRFYSWIRSYYHQTIHPDNINAKEQHFRFTEDEEIHPGFYALMRERQQHIVQYLYDIYAELYGSKNIRVVSLDHLPPPSSAGADALIEHFACNVFQQKYHVCEDAKNGNVQIVQSNVDQTDDYAVLVRAAFERNIVPGPSTRGNVKKATKAVRQYAELHNTTIPMQCLPQETLNELRDLSWKMEVNFFSHIDPASGSFPINETDHRGAFLRSVKAKFCFPDVETALNEDSIWVDFLSNLSLNER